MARASCNNILKHNIEITTFQNVQLCHAHFFILTRAVTFGFLRYNVCHKTIEKVSKPRYHFIQGGKVGSQITDHGSILSFIANHRSR